MYCSNGIREPNGIWFSWIYLVFAWNHTLYQIACQTMSTSSISHRTALHHITLLWQAKTFIWNQTALLPRNISHLDYSSLPLPSHLQLLYSYMRILNQNFCGSSAFLSYNAGFTSSTIVGHISPEPSSTTSLVMSQSHTTTIPMLSWPLLLLLPLAFHTACIMLHKHHQHLYPVGSEGCQCTKNLEIRDC